MSNSSTRSKRRGETGPACCFGPGQRKLRGYAKEVGQAFLDRPIPVPDHLGRVDERGEEVAIYDALAAVGPRPCCLDAAAARRMAKTWLAVHQRVLEPAPEVLPFDNADAGFDERRRHRLWHEVIWDDFPSAGFIICFGFDGFAVELATWSYALLHAHKALKIIWTDSPLGEGAMPWNCLELGKVAVIFAVFAFNPTRHLPSPGQDSHHRNRKKGCRPYAHSLRHGGRTLALSPHADRAK